MIYKENEIPSIYFDSEEKIKIYKGQNLVYGIGEKKGTNIRIEDSEDAITKQYTIYGKSWQGGDPSPENPAVIRSVGSSGAYVKHGKNLIDMFSAKYFTKSTDDEILCVENNLHYTNSVGIFTNIDLPVGIYTISYDIKSALNVNARIHVEYVDGTDKRVYVNSNNNFEHVVFTTGNKKIQRLYIGYNISGGVYIKNLQLELGSEPTDYEPYWEKTVYPVEIKTCGKNLFDLNTAVSGYLNGNSEIVANNVWKTSNFISVNPDTDYYLTEYKGTAPRNIIYDSNKSIITTFLTGSQMVHTPSNAAFIRVMEYYDGASAKTHTQLELGSLPTDYEPYKETTQTLELDQPLRGIPVADPTLATYTDEMGQMWCADTVDSTGAHIQRVDSDGNQLDTPIITEVQAEVLPLFKGTNTITVTDNAYTKINYYLEDNYYLETPSGKNYFKTTKEFDYVTDNLILIKYNGTELNPEVPYTINNIHIKKIGLNSFSKSKIESAYIPEGIEEIE